MTDVTDVTVVSVIIPCFNYGAFLEEAVTSVLAQGVADCEIVIVDDGSADDSAAVARRLAAAHPGVSLIAQPNSGQPAIARNNGIAASTGRYVICLDADDAMGPGMLERCIAVLDADASVGMAYPQLEFFGGQTGVVGQAAWDLEQLARCNYMPTATLFRREAWEAVGGYSTNVRGYEDWDLWLGCAAHGFPGRPARGARFRYRIHGPGLYADAQRRDPELKAQVVLNRPSLYGERVRRWAQGVLAGEPAALAVAARVGWVPDFGDSRRPLRLLAVVPALDAAVVREQLATLAHEAVDVHVLDGTAEGIGPVAGGVAVEFCAGDAMAARADGIAAGGDHDWYLVLPVGGLLEAASGIGTLRDAVALADRLGFAAIRCDVSGARPATVAGPAPRCFKPAGGAGGLSPIPLLVHAAGDPAAARAAARAEALERSLVATVTAQALRGFRPTGMPLDAMATARFAGVGSDEVENLLAHTALSARLLADDQPLPQVDGEWTAALTAMSSVLGGEALLRGDADAALRASALRARLRRSGLEGARSFTSLAFAAEIVNDPSLLAAYGRHFSADDDATLIIVADADTDELARAVGAAGMDTAQAADLLAVGAVPRCPDALYSRRPAPVELAGVARYDERSLTGLRHLMELRAPAGMRGARIGSALVAP